VRIQVDLNAVHDQGGIQSGGNPWQQFPAGGAGEADQAVDFKLLHGRDHCGGPNDRIPAAAAGADVDDAGHTKGRQRRLGIFGRGIHHQGDELPVFSMGGRGQTEIGLLDPSVFEFDEQSDRDHG
jgi:hypothetical protein